MAAARAICALKLFRRGHSHAAPSSSLQLLRAAAGTQQQQRYMGGGPRNPEHKNRPKEEKQDARRAKIEQRKAKAKPPSESLIQNTQEQLDKPISPEILSYIPAMESYVLKKWLPMYPGGARLRKLQRDVAWRMNRKQSPGKLDFEMLLPFVGTLVRKGLVETRVNQRGVLILLQPEHNKKDGDEASSIMGESMDLDIEESRPT